jgi:hypothetical protein
VVYAPKLRAKSKAYTPLRQRWHRGREIPSAKAAETIGLPHWEQSGSGSVCVRAYMQAWQNGMRLPVSRIRAQIRHGAGRTSEASASPIPRKRERRESAILGTVAQAYPGRDSRGSEMCHDSCQLTDVADRYFSERK